MSAQSLLWYTSFTMLTKLSIQRVETLFYIILLLTGTYFIYYGDVLQRYIEQKTNYYQYDEPIKELPSITTWVDPMLLDPSIIKLGRDYNISLGAAGKISETNMFTYFASVFVCAIPGSPWRRGFIKGQIRAGAGQAGGIYKTAKQVNQY